MAGPSGFEPAARPSCMVPGALRLDGGQNYEDAFYRVRPQLVSTVPARVRSAREGVTSLPWPRARLRFVVRFGQAEKATTEVAEHKQPYYDPGDNQNFHGAIVRLN